MADSVGLHGPDRVFSANMTGNAVMLSAVITGAAAVAGHRAARTCLSFASGRCQE